MRKSSEHIDKYRITVGELGSDNSFGLTGSFKIPHQKSLSKVYIIVSSGSVEESDWEHVSCHVREKRGRKILQSTPTWDDMCYIKGLFWTDDETVIQYHPAKKYYVNTHKNVLHLWKHKKLILPTPSMHLV